MSRLDEIRARFNTVSSTGPWRVGKTNSGRGSVISCDNRVVAFEFRENGNAKEFIANAPSDIKWLMDRVDLLEDKLAAAEERVAALEMAICSVFPCELCKNDDYMEFCGRCEHWIEGPGEDLWDFDQSRFAPEGVSNDG